MERPHYAAGPAQARIERMKSVAPVALNRAVYLRDLLRELISRDLKIRYKRSYLGIIWSLLTPLVQVLIFSFLFRMVLPLGIESYTAFVFAGILAWSWFSTALASASWAVVSNPELVRRPGFPTGILPVLTIASNGIHFLIALPILLAVAMIDGGAPGTSLLALPLVVVVQFLFMLGLAYIIATSNVRFRDTQHLVSLVLMAAFYLTPIFYRSESVPEQFRFIHELNPMATILTAYRDIFINGVWPQLGDLAAVAVVATVLMAVGYGMYLRVSTRFAEEL
jgi:lipopolysaccharide transport system permease protein